MGRLGLFALVGYLGGTSMLEDEQESGSATMTVEELTDTVSDSVAERVGGIMDGLFVRLDNLETDLKSVETDLQSVAGRLQVEGLAQRVDSLSARVEEAALQAGEEIGPVLTEEVGTVIISLIGQLLDLTDEDGDGASDVAATVEELRADVGNLSASLVHPAMSTNFADYTVLEALLLLLLVWQVIKFWLGRLGDGFRWLR